MHSFLIGPCVGCRPALSAPRGARFTAPAAGLIALLLAGSLPVVALGADSQPQPNVVLIMTDDQGYGDVACHGNDDIRTPALDRLHAQSVRLTDFHVDPTCSPTRAALMTGRYSSRTGVWHTIMGRSLLHEDELTMAEVFAAGGYRTGIFGKWHLGDNFPYRPGDRGFHEVLVHGGGGVGQTPDYWANDYSGDTYFHNGRPEQFDGYCTDVWFDAALEFIESHRDRPFFCYIPTNAAHGPFRVPEKYSRPYKQKGIPSPRAEFYGMITNIDENVDRLRTKLKEWNLDRNTLLIFMTDNGTAAGTRGGGHNAGMRGTKGSEYEGGHRVPCFIRWPAGDIGGGRDVDELTAHIDLLPTLVDLCGLEWPRSVNVDGTSLTPLLKDPESRNWPDRTLFVHSQRIEHPRPWRKCAVMTEHWRLVANGDRRELFDMQTDSGQQNDVAEDHPAVVRKLSRAYEQWYEDIGDRFDGFVRIPLGHPEAQTVHLTCHDWHTGDGRVPWNQTHIRRDLAANGFWTVDVVREGAYEITLRSRPFPYRGGPEDGRPLQARSARLKIGNVEKTKPLEPGSTSATFQVDLSSGPARLQTWLRPDDGASRGAYFVRIRYRPDN